MGANDVLDLESVRCFLAAVDRPSFRGAAAAVHLSPQAFGDRIRRLEEDLGTALFTRTTRTVRVTPAGARFAVEARHLLAEAARCRSAVAEGRTRPFELTIGTRFELGLGYLVPALDRLARSAPTRTLHLYFGDSADLASRAARGDVDAFVSSARLSLAGFDYASLHRETYVFVGERRYLEALPLETAADARRHTLVDAHAELPLFRYFQDAVSPEPSFRFARIERMGTIAAVRARVLDRKGVAVLPEYFVRRELARGRLVRLFEKVRLKEDVFRLVFRAGHPLEVELRRLADELARIPLG